MYSSNNKWRHGTLVRFKNTKKVAKVVFYNRSKILIQTEERQYWVGSHEIEKYEGFCRLAKNIKIPSKTDCMNAISEGTRVVDELKINYSLLTKDIFIIRDTIAGSIIRSMCVQISPYQTSTDESEIEHD